MSWLLKSLQVNDDGGDRSPPEDSPAAAHGVKEDLSVIGNTIGRQLRGVAAFLAPPPSTPPLADSVAEEEEEESVSSPSPAFAGIRNDLVEIGGSFKSGLSRLSSTKAVAGISKFASNLLQFQEEIDEEEYESDDDGFEGIAGITDEVVDFVREISTRPECWVDFPLSLDNDIKLSDVQREHTSAIEQLVPGLAALRENLHSCMEDVQFWMIYFILLLPRLDGQDAELLATPRVVETRDLLLQKLQKNRNTQAESSGDLETPEELSEKHVSENVKEIAGEVKALKIDHKENPDQSSEETDADVRLHTSRNLEADEDISFSDLEDDDNDLSSKLSSHTTARDPSPSGSSDWVQLNRSLDTRSSRRKPGESSSQGKDSEGEDWLAIDDSD